LHRGSGRTAIVVLAASLVLIMLAPSVEASSHDGRGALGSAAVAVVGVGAAASPCTGPSVPSAYLGTLTVQGGGAFPPGVKNLTVVVTYAYTLNFTPNGGSPIVSCKNGSASAVTGVSGSFSVALPIPTSSCNSASCSTFSGPFAPVSVHVAGGAPAGYFLTTSVQGSTIGLAFVAALAKTALTPSSRVTLSTDAPTLVRATPQSGNGGPSPATVAFAWAIVGAGWTLLNGSGTDTAWIEASDGAAPGGLEVWVNGSYNGTPVVAPAVTLGLAAAATAATSGGVVPTRLDADLPATFTVGGTGAGGYAYSAVIAPGLGAPSVVAPCTTASASGGLVALSCAASVAYAMAGTAQPSAVLSNGYSSASWRFPDVVVATALAASVVPSSAVEYPNVATTVTVSVAAGTGTSPFGRGCVWPGDGRLLCVDGPGPTYAFPLSFGAPGTYVGRASVEDAGGANVSIPWTTDVFDRPSLTNLLAGSNTALVGSSVPISAVVTGGALPLTYWWNASSPAGTLYEGTTESDGSLVLDFVPHIAGLTVITLTVVDALGTVVAKPIPMAVAPGMAVAIAPSGGPPTWTTAAGSPYSVSWAAVDNVGETVTGNGTVVTLQLLPTTGDRAVPVWVNGSGGPVTPDGSGTYALEGADWSHGFLNFTIDIGASGTFVWHVAASLPVTDAPGGDRLLRVTPDRQNVLLSHPTIAFATDRSAATLYRIADRFGDPLDGGYVIVRSVFDGATSYVYPPIRSNASVATVWVNFSAPGPGGGTVYVLSDQDRPLLAPINVPAAAPALSVSPYWLGLAIAGMGLLAVALYARHRRTGRLERSRPAFGPHDPSTEDELKRIAEGRAHVLARADPTHGRTLDELAAGFVGPPPAPEELTEWVASLVAEGSLRTVLGPDGRSRFLRVERAGETETVTVELDDGALQAALDRRNADGPDPPSGPA